MALLENDGVVSSLDIEFRDLSYSVPNQKRRQIRCCCGDKRGSVKDARVQILHNVSGKFRAGELTAVLGPSGAGKTSLLSILSGFRTSGVEGEILLNGQPRSSVLGASSRRICCLIPQEFAMLDVLTVKETMYVASLLKLGTNSLESSRTTKIRDTSTLLGLDSCLNTAVGCLSGGEKKRLSCGVELLSNPPLMFFDEPTSGLDACSAQQVLSHLQGLAHRDHRNIICSIHQPGSRLFQGFDSVFVLTSGGRCLVRGPRNDLLSTLENAGFPCPSYYNPAEFVLEVATGERGDTSDLLALTATPESSTIVKQDDGIITIDNMAVQTTIVTDENALTRCHRRLTRLCIPGRQYSDKLAVVAPSPVCNAWQQFMVLLARATRCSFRDLHMARLRFLAHIFIGLMLGAIFYQIGNDAAQLMSNIGCIFFLMLFLFFSNAMPTVHTFPAEMSVMLREHQNGWYSIRAYYMARSIADLPLQLFCPTAFLAISYFLTGQPCELRPFLQIWLVGILLTLVAQSLGLLVGAASDVKMGIFLVPVISIPMLLFSGYFVRIQDIPEYLQWISHLSAFRYAFEACLVAIYGYGRDKLPCSLPFCPIRLPAKFLSEMHLSDDHFNECVIALTVYTLILRIFIYCALKIRVRAAK